MRIAILSAGNGWHVRDVVRAARELGHEAVPVDFRRVAASVNAAVHSLSGFDGVMVRTMPPGSLEQVIFRMDVLQRLQAEGVPVLFGLAETRLQFSRFVYLHKILEKIFRNPDERRYHFKGEVAAEIKPALKSNAR